MNNSNDINNNDSITNIPSESVVTTPAEPVVVPSEPVVTTPVEPVVVPSEPVVTTPAEPVVVPSEPVVTTPAEPIVVPNNTPNNDFNKKQTNDDDEYVDKKEKTSIFTIITRLFLIAIIGFLVYLFFTKEGMNIVYKNLGFKEIEVSIFLPNKYYKNDNYDYVQITDDFVAKDKQHLMNIYYTIANSGADEFTFACSSEYKECLDDVREISNSELILSNIKAFIHPFNSFSRIETNFSTQGEVIIKFNKVYSDKEIIEIETAIEKITTEQDINPDEIHKVIKAYHDYIINNTKYDTARSENQIIEYKSENAYGALIQGFGLCEAYTDAMALFLNYYNIPNYKVMSAGHVWNAVFYEGKWYHLDLTWDDPVTTSGRDTIRDTYFLITTKKLLEIEKTEHNFDFNVFKEVSIN